MSKPGLPGRLEPWTEIRFHWPVLKRSSLAGSLAYAGCLPCAVQWKNKGKEAHLSALGEPLAKGAVPVESARTWPRVQGAGVLGVVLTQAQPSPAVAASIVPCGNAGKLLLKRIERVGNSG